MLAMDVSDVYYEKFLINGKNKSQLSQFKGGDKVRFRISNGGASSYFWLTYAGGKITVVANDGNDVEPVEVDRLIIGVSETYDVIVTIPSDNTAFEFLATAEDRTKSASIYLGSGIKQLASPLPKLNCFEGMKMMNNMMNVDGSMDDMGMSMSLQKMDMNTVMYPEISGKASPKKMEHPKMKMEMNEKMDSTMNHSTHSMTTNSSIKTLNYSMLKATDKTTLPTAAPVKELHFELTGNMNRYVWSMAQNDFATNGNDGMFMFQNARWSVGTEWRLGYHDQHGYETETHIGRYIGKNQWLMPFVGFDWRYRKTDGIAETNIFGQSNTKDNRAVLSAGLEYTLPMLVKFQGEVFTDGNVRFQLMREDIPLTRRLRMAFMVNTDKEYMAGLKYIATKNLAISTHYDSDMGFGVGMTVNY
jgi:hypothetical protein